MPTPTIANIFRVTFEWQMGAFPKRAVNVMHFSAPGKTEADVLDALDSNHHSGMFTLVTSEAKVVLTTAQKLDGSSAPHERDVSGDTEWTGSGSNQAIPQGAAVVSLSTGIIGRSNHGRIYLPYIAEDEQDSGTLNVTDVGTVTTAWDTFANDMIADGVALGVASYKNSNWHQAVGVLCKPRLCTQRRRQFL